MYFGAALAPDSNPGSSSDEEVINIGGLPFTRDSVRSRYPARLQPLGVLNLPGFPEAPTLDTLEK